MSFYNFFTQPTEDPVSDNDGDQSYDDDNDSNPDSDSSHEYLEKSKQKAPKKVCLLKQLKYINK